MQSAIVRINELQNEIKEQSKQIEGAQKYVDEQLKLFKQDMALRKQFKTIEEQGEKIAEDFFKHNSEAIKQAKIAIERGNHRVVLDENLKRLIEDAVKTSQAIEGSISEASEKLQKEVEQIMKTHNIKVLPPEKSDDSE